MSFVYLMRFGAEDRNSTWIMSRMRNHPVLQRQSGTPPSSFLFLHMDARLLSGASDAKSICTI
jgi:hypothetical protein